MDLTQKFELAEQYVDRGKINLTRKALSNYARVIKDIEEHGKTEQESEELLLRILYENTLPIGTQRVNGKEVTRRITIPPNSAFLISTLEKIIEENAKFTELFDSSKLDKYTNRMQKSVPNDQKNIDQLIGRYFQRLPSTEKNKIIKGTLTKEEKRKYDEDFLNTQKLYLKETVFNQDSSYTRILTGIITFLDAYGVLEENSQRHNARMEELDIPFMKVEYYSEKENDKLELVTDCMDPKIVAKLPIETRQILTAFYSNRLVKQVQDISLAIFISRQNKGLKNLSKIPNDTLKKYIARYETMTRIIKKSFNEIQDKVERGEEVGKRTGNIIYLDDEITTDINEKEYDDFWGKGAFKNDLGTLTTSVGIMKSLYSFKNWSIETIMYLAAKGEDNFKNINWGYIPEYTEDGKNSIENKRKNILMGFDFPRFNMPIRIHTDLDRIKRLITEMTGDSYIPVYKGDKDFEVMFDGKRQNLTAQVIMPISKKQRKQLDTTIKREDTHESYRNFYEHLNWLAYPNRVPPKLAGKEQKVNLNSGRIMENKKIPDNSDDSER